MLPVLGRAGLRRGELVMRSRRGRTVFRFLCFSFDPAADFREVVKDERGRRVYSRRSRRKALLLKKPTLAVEHEGGRRLEVGSPFYQIITRLDFAGHAVSAAGRARSWRASPFSRVSSVMPSRRSSSWWLPREFDDGSTQGRDAPR